MASSATERVAVIKECLEYKDSTGVKKLILEDKFKDDAYFWELVTLLGACLTEENLQQCPGFFEVCERCINYIVKVGKASELILALLEQADSFDDTVKFQSFLQIIQKALLQLESRQQFSLEISLETLSDCIKNLEAPKSLDLEGEERRAHDLDPNVDKINKYVVAYLEFLKPFVEQVASGQEATFKGENFTRQVDCLVRCLINVLDHPLVLLDLTMSNAEDDAQKIKSDSRICAERLMQHLTTMYPNLNDLVKKLIMHNEKITRMERRKKKNDTSSDVNGVDGASAVEPFPELGLSCLAYLVHHDPMWYTQAGVGPSLCIPQGILEQNLPYVLALLRRRQSEVCRKGVLLLQTLIAMQNETTQLTCGDLDRPEYHDILDAMFDIMIHCSVKEIRMNCLKLVPGFMGLFVPDARYRIYFKVFATQKHPGAYGYCVQLFKSQLDEILKTADPTETKSSKFCNVGLHRIFNLITTLSEGAATDIVENSDRIIAVLNLCRYIILRDPPTTNQTGFWDFQEKMQKNFLSELQTGLEMSKGHYQLELTGLKEGGENENKNQSAEKQEVEMSVCVAGFKLPKMERGQKEGILRMALNTLDLVASLVARLGELTDQQKRLAKTQ